MAKQIYINTEDGFALTDMNDCLATTQPEQLSNDDQEPHGLMVCCVCLSSRSVRPLRPAARKFLVSLATYSSEINGLLSNGVCRWCWPWLRRAALVADRAAEAQGALQRLQDYGELNLASVTKLSNSARPLCQLSPAHLGPDHFTREYVYDEVALADLNLASITKLSNNTRPLCQLGPAHLGPDHFTNEYAYDEDPFADNQDLLKEEEIDCEIQYVNFDMLDMDIGQDKNETQESDSENDIGIKSENSDSEYDLSQKPTKVENKKVKVTVKNKVKKVKKNEAEDNKDPTIRKFNSRLTNVDLLIRDHFETQILSPAEQKAEFLSRKDGIAYKRARLKCHICFKGFKHDRAYAVHKAKHNKKTGGPTCNICQLPSRNKRSLRKHIVDIHMFSYKCIQCDYETKCKHSAKLHLHWHNGKRYNCEECGQTFERSSSLLGHKRIKHPSDHVCVLCGYSYLGEKGLYFHRHLTHKLEDDTIPEDGPLCVKCNIRFKSADGLAVHIRVSPKHGGWLRNDRRQEAIGRPRRQTKERDATLKNRREISCEQCGVQMSSRRAYRAHFNMLHPNCAPTQLPAAPKPSLCEQCGKVFQDQKQLETHSVVHVVENNYECDICQRKFKGKGHLARHIVNMHTDGKGMRQCKICGKRLTNLYRHLKTHGPKRYQCNLCERAFTIKPALEVHIRHVHMKVPYAKRNRKNEKRRSCVD